MKQEQLGAQKKLYWPFKKMLKRTPHVQHQYSLTDSTELYQQDTRRYHQKIPPDVTRCQKTTPDVISFQKTTTRRLHFILPLYTIMDGCQDYRGRSHISLKCADNMSRPLLTMQVSLRDITVRDYMNVNMTVCFRWTEINLFFKLVYYLCIHIHSEPSLTL